MQSTNRPRLLVLCSTFPARLDDGVPAFVLDLAREEARDFSTLVLTPRVPGAAARERFGDVRVARYPYFLRPFEDLADGAILDNLKERRSRIVQVPALLIAQFFAVRKAVRQFRPDVIHAHWTIPQGLIAAVAAPGISLVVTTHGGDIYALKGALFTSLKRFVFGRSARVTTVNSDMATRLAQWGVPSSSIDVISMGVDLEPATAVAEHAVREPGRIVVVGRLVEKKGFGVLLSALRGIDQSTWQLTVIGDGPLREELEKQAEGLPVDFLGQQGRNQVLAALASATVVALPSVEAASGDQEGLPVTLLEAAAVGATIVASDLVGVREAMDDGRAALLVTPGDVTELETAVRRLLGDDSLRAELADRARVAASGFSSEVIGERYRAVLRSAVDQS